MMEWGNSQLIYRLSTRDEKNTPRATIGGLENHKAHRSTPHRACDMAHSPWHCKCRNRIGSSTSRTGGCRLGGQQPCGQDILQVASSRVVGAAIGLKRLQLGESKG